MPADIKLDQEIVLKADELIYEGDNGDDYLKISKIAEGGRIEGRAYTSGKIAGTISLSFGYGSPGGSIIALTNEREAPAETAVLDGSHSRLELNRGSQRAFLNPDLFILREGKTDIVKIERGDSICKLQLNQNATPAVSAQSSFDGGSVVLYDGEGQPSIVLDGRTGTIYARGEIQQGVEQALLDSLAAALVW